ncbi:MAG TPA: hypothetical protein VK950_03095 [Methylophilus sp.]|nr:hypothetical protein [Methylophilus sp.]
MQASKILRQFALSQFIAICMLTLICLLSSKPGLADDASQSAQLLTLQNKVSALEKELFTIKSMLNQSNRSDGISASDNNKIVISAPDKLILKSGRSSLELSKNGSITLTGVRFDVKTTEDQQMHGTKINDN